MGDAVDSIRVRAFYQGLAGDPQATTVSAERLAALADGLGGEPVDGKVDAIETRAMLTIARNVDLPKDSLEQIRQALANRSPLSIPSGETPSGPTRFPPYLDLSTLRTTENTCGCGAKLGTLQDAAGNSIGIARNTDPLTGIMADGLIVRFARAGQPLDKAPSIALNAAETAALAPHLVAVQLRESREAPKVEPWSTDWGALAQKTRVTPGTPADERDLSGLGHWNHGYLSTFGFRVDDGSTVFVRVGQGDKQGLSIAYSRGGIYDEPKSFRPMSQRELETFVLSQRSDALTTDLGVRNAAASLGFMQLTR